MYSNLKQIGIHHPEEIKRYSLRQEGGQDVLKVYFKKQNGTLIGRSSKFKFQRQKKKVSGGPHTQHFTSLSEISPTLRKIIKELDSLTVQIEQEEDIKKQILSDLKHLQSVVNNKVDEIEKKLQNK